MSYQDYIDRQNQELMDDLLGRGPGDPDAFGYPDKHVDNEPIGEYVDKDGNDIVEAGGEVAN